jgi:hypothetical protein
MTTTTAQLATELDTTPRELRKFLRSDASGIDSVGKGSRYALPGGKREIASLKKRFVAWDDARNVVKSDNEVNEVETTESDESAE